MFKMIKVIKMTIMMIHIIKIKKMRRQEEVLKLRKLRQQVTVLHFSGALDPICSSSNSEKKLWYFPTLVFSETWYGVRGHLTM